MRNCWNLPAIPRCGHPSIFRSADPFLSRPAQVGLPSIRWWGAFSWRPPGMVSDGQQCWPGDAFFTDPAVGGALQLRSRVLFLRHLWRCCCLRGCVYRCVIYFYYLWLYYYFLCFCLGLSGHGVICLAAMKLVNLHQIASPGDWFLAVYSGAVPL